MHNNFSPVATRQLHVPSSVRYWFKWLFQANKSFHVKPLPIKCLHIFTLTVIFIWTSTSPQVSIEMYPINVGVGLGDSIQKSFYWYVFNICFPLLSFLCSSRSCPGNWPGCNDRHSQPEPQAERRHVHGRGRPSLPAAHGDAGGVNAFENSAEVTLLLECMLSILLLAFFFYMWAAFRWEHFFISYH